MLKKTIACFVLAGGAVLGTATSALAQQTLNFNIGYFALRGESGRVGANCNNCGANVDVLVANRDFLAFNIKDFNSAMVGGEWLVPLGNFFEGGAGIGFTKRTVPTVYRDYVQADGSEVDQKLQLRTVPVTFTVRALPFGQTEPIQPYIGAGISVINWRYRETGNFIDFSTVPPTVFCAGTGAGCDPAFEAKGTATGPVILGGIRFAGPTISAGGEVRYQRADKCLVASSICKAVGPQGVGSDFAGNKLDLGGWTYMATVGYRFGR